MKKIYLILLILFFIPIYVFADMAISMMYFGIPLIILGLIPVIIIEIIVFYIRTKFKINRLSISITIANIVTTIIGYPLVCFFLLIFQKITDGNQTSIYSVIVYPRHGSKWLIPSALIFELILTYFLSTVIEYFIIKNFYNNELKKEIFKSTWIANIFSYLFLIISFIIFFITRAFT
jgi:hypothetical protein